MKKANGLLTRFRREIAARGLQNNSSGKIEISIITKFKSNIFIHEAGEIHAIQRTQCFIKH